MNLATLAVLTTLATQEAARFQPVLAPDAALTLDAFWEPCRRSKYGLFEQTEVLKTPAPAEQRHTYGAAELEPFLPPSAVALGDTWKVESEAVLAFLRQLHPGARARLHHGYGSAPGTFALLRAASDERIEILFRAHAEFELAGGVTYTPAQFEGRLVLARASGRPLALTIALPERDTNVDVNVPAEYTLEDGTLTSGFAADIGWVPRLELASGPLSPEDDATSDATAARSIPLDDARLRLARRFYAFARLDWLAFDQAVSAARALGKPLHVVVLFGTLDDESC